MSDQPSTPRTKTQLQFHSIVKTPAPPTRPMAIPELDVLVSASATSLPVVREEPEVTQSGSLNALLPFDHKLERMTDWRLTRAWCQGKNTAPIVDKVAVGRTPSAERRALVLCGSIRPILPRLHRDDEGE